jgi:histidyl-tRNA synthetase
MASINSDPPRGMRDLLPGQVRLRDWASSVIQASYSRFGFTRIETPVMENIQHLRGAEGGENLQLIYEVLKRGDKLERVLENRNEILREELSDLGLRFDLTVPLVRYYAANQSNLPNPLKAVQIGPVFRAESPQKGRFRQFTQCDIDIIGVKSELAELELISATSAALLELGFENFSILINDRRFLSSLAEYCGFAPESVSSVFIALDKLEKIGPDQVKAELLAATASQPSVERLMQILKAYVARLEEGQPGFENMREIFGELLDHDYMRVLQKIIAAVDAASDGRYTIRFDPTLVRGMGYYTGPIFEVKSPGYSGSIAGGGRYDKMVGKFSGRDAAACGFSIGFERVIDILTDRGFEPPVQAGRIALIVDPDRDDGADILKAATALRNGGNLVSIQPRKKDMRKQLDSLMEQGYTQYCPFRGDLNKLELKPLKTQEPSA